MHEYSTIFLTVSTVCCIFLLKYLQVKVRIQVQIRTLQNERANEKSKTVSGFCLAIIKSSEYSIFQFKWAR